MIKLRKTNGRLKAGEERYRRFMSMLSDAVLMYCGGRCVFANAAAARLFGAASSRKMLGQDVIDLAHPDFLEFVQQRINLAYGGEFENLQKIKILRLDGHPVDVEILALAINYQGLPAIQMVLRDMTCRTIADKALRQNEEHLRRIAKLEPMVNMASGLAHDLNNVLTAILGHISLASLASTRPEELRDQLASAEQGCLKVKTLVQQLLLLVKGGTPPKNYQDLVKILKDAARLAVAPSNASVAFSLPDHLWSVKADPVQMYQVFTNLFINAVQAMPTGGVIKVKARNLNEKEATERSLPAERYMEVTVTDQGTGIAVEHLEKIFRPYFSTKPQGCGLGLATVSAIVANHQGHIKVESKLGKGTTFQVFLPARDREVMPVPEENRESHFGKG